MTKINKITMQIKALNVQIESGRVKNIYAVKNKIKTLKYQLKIELDSSNWWQYLNN